MNLKWLKIVGLCLLSLVILAFLFLLYHARRTRLDAQTFTDDLSTLQIGHSSFQDVISVQHKFASYVLHSSQTPQACSPEHCELVFAFRNWPALLTLHESDVKSAVLFQSGSLQQIYLGAECAAGNRKPPFVPTFVVIVNQSSLLPPGLHGGASSTGNGYVFNIGPGAIPEELSKVYDFNFDFLSRFSGCHDATEMFTDSPSTWPQSWWAK